jgi:hypothetical protein
MFLVTESCLTLRFLQRTILVSSKSVLRTFPTIQVSESHIDIFIHLAIFLAYYADMKENMHEFLFARTILCEHLNSSFCAYKITELWDMMNSCKYFIMHACKKSISYYYMGNALWSSLFFVFVIRSKRLVEWLAQPCTCVGHDHTMLLATWATQTRTRLGRFMMTASLCTSRCQYCTRGSFKNTQTLSGMDKCPNRPYGVELWWYDHNLSCTLYLYCIAYFLWISTFLHASTFYMEKHFYKTMSSQNG